MRKIIPCFCLIQLLAIVYLSGPAYSEEKFCVKKLYGGNKISKACLEDYSFTKTIVEKKSGQNFTLMSKIEKKSCYELAFSNDNACLAFGWSDDQQGSDYCWHQSGRDKLRVSALEKCEQGGCKCKIVISNGKVLDEELLLKLDVAYANEITEMNIQGLSTGKSQNLNTPNKNEMASHGPSNPMQDQTQTHQNIAKNEKSQTDKINMPEMQVKHSQPDAEGDFLITVSISRDTASLKINDEEIGGRKDGQYQVKKVARAGQNTEFIIIARDINGNTLSKTITVARPITESKPRFAALNPANIKKHSEREAVAIIIGIADYKNMPRAEFANDDARLFYDYAIRALGIKPENIKLLIDSDADQAEIYRAFKTWLPSQVHSNTDVFVYYSGHGLPTADGQGIYVLPQRADKDFIDKTAITQQEINAAIQATKPRSVVVFLDACYSGQSRSGDTLVTGSRPVSLKVGNKLFPDNFSVFTASQADQISSSSPDLKHGIFSYFLMRGMEGDADSNRDGKITLGEIYIYLAAQVTRQAGMLNRKQDPQFLGNVDAVLVGK